MFSAYFTLGLNTLVSLYSDIFYASHLPQCRSLPSDASWPAADIWAAFNQSVDGRLVKTLPLGSPCHHPSYDEEQCQYLRANWRRPELQYVFSFLHSDDSTSNSIIAKPTLPL